MIEKEINNMSYAISDDGELYGECYPTKEKAIENGMKQYAELEEFFVGEAYFPEIEFNDDESIADEIIEKISESLDYECPGVAGEYFHVSDKQYEKLTQVIKAAVDKWIDEADVKAGFFVVRESEKIRIPKILK